MDNQVKNPRNHQKEAIIASLQCDKGKVILPTGTGKTLVESDIIRGLIEQDSDCANGVYVIVAPRILLAYQNLTNVAERLTKHNIQCKYLNVNSGSFNDATLNRCIDGLGLQAYNIESTTDFSEISRIYGICFNKKMPLVISCTYHSANQIQKSRIPVNAYLFDEAHYLADNGRFHEATRYQSTRKYFFTATPRTTEDVTSGSGMDNEARYGTTIYTKSPKEMIEAGEMVKPAIHLVGVVGNSAPVDGEIDDYSANYDYKNISNAIISSFFEHSDAVRKYAAFPDRIGAKFLVTLEGQRSLKGVWDSVEFQQFMVANPHIHVFALSTDFGVAINGKRYKNSNNSKEILFAAVQSLKSTDQAIMMHVDMLSEGIDVPGITGVMPFRNFGKIKFLQNTGRSTRLFGDDRTKLYDGSLTVMDLANYTKPYAWVVLPVFTENAIDFTERYKNILRSMRNEYGFSPSELIIHSNRNSVTELEEFDEAGALDREIRSTKTKIVEFFHQLEKEEQMEFLIDKYFKVNSLRDGRKGIMWRLLLKDSNLFTDKSTYDDSQFAANVADYGETIACLVRDFEEMGSFRGVEGKNIRRQIIMECLNDGDQYVGTPFSLCNDMVGKLDECVRGNGRDLREMKIAVVFNVEFVETLIFDYNVPPENIVFFADSASELQFVGCGYGIRPSGVNIFYINRVNRKTKLPVYRGKNSAEKLASCVEVNNMKFDCVVMNPPYQSSQDNKGKRGGGTSLWDKFVNIAIDSLIEDDGYLCAVHPCGWRSPSGRYEDTKKCITDNWVYYLEIHNAQDGQKVFGAGTRYDWYILRKAKPALTTIKSEDGSIHQLNINNISFLPHGEFDKVYSLIAKEDEEKCEVLYSRSAYGSDKKWMSKEQTDIFKYPVVHSIKKGGLSLLWSSKEITPYFARPKIIFGCGQSRTYIDIEGKYGLSQHTRAIVADKKDLEDIDKVLNNEKFINLMKNCVYISTSQFIDKYDKNVIALFCKDFWKEFIK